MTALSEIPGIGATSLELLEIAGVHDIEALASSDPDALTTELKKANEVLAIAKRNPSSKQVTKWIGQAREFTGYVMPAEVVEESKPTALPVNYEGSEEVAGLLEGAPFAIPLPGRIMMENQIGVSDIPAGLLLNRYSGDLDVRVDSTAPVKSDVTRNDVPIRRDNGSLERHETEVQRLHFDASQVKSTSSRLNTVSRVPSARKMDGHELDRVSLIRAPLEKTNAGKNPNSRRYVRGVLHTHPYSLRAGAILTLLLLVILPLAIASAFLLLASDQNPEHFGWVPKWILAFPIALPLAGLCYMIWGFNGKCRICTQKLFVPKGSNKHEKSHRFPGLGYVIPLSLHLLVFSWFRCSSCGTPVRLKK